MYIFFCSLTLCGVAAFTDRDSSKICMWVCLQLAEEDSRDVKVDPFSVVILISKETICHHRRQIH